MVDRVLEEVKNQGIIDNNVVTLLFAPPIFTVSIKVSRETLIALLSVGLQLQFFGIFDGIETLCFVFLALLKTAYLSENHPFAQYLMVHYECTSRSTIALVQWSDM
jgi:hypothetical protein